MKHAARLLVGLSALGLLAGCYASERIGTDIRNVSHDVNQGGIYMHKGALTVYRPERHPETPALTNASLPAPAESSTGTAAPTDTSMPAPMATPEWKPPADGSEALPKMEPTTPPSPPATPPAAADAGAVFSM